MSRRIDCLFLLVLSGVLAPGTPGPRAAETPAAGSGPRIWAIEMQTDDLDRSAGFYTGALGFRVERRDPSGRTIELRNGEGRLVLSLTDAPAAPAGTARVYLNMSVGDVHAAARKAASHGGRIVDRVPRTSAVGPFLEVSDPYGHPIHLIDHPWDEMAAGDTPAVFNYGLNVRSIEEDEPFMTTLGLEVATRDYLPETLVFKRQGIGYVVMHQHAERTCDPGWSAGALILAGGIRGAAGEMRGPSGILVKLMASD